MVKTYDEKCFELAQHFLDEKLHADHAALVDQLAREIQNTIEDFLYVAKLNRTE